MSGYFKGQVESGASDSNRAAVDSGAAVGAEPGGSAGERRGRAVEGERGGSDTDRTRLDEAVCVKALGDWIRLRSEDELVRLLICVLVRNLDGLTTSTLNQPAAIRLACLFRTVFWRWLRDAFVRD